MVFTVYKITAPDGRGYIGCTSKTPDRRWREHVIAANSWQGYVRGSLSEHIKAVGADGYDVTTLATVTEQRDAAAIETALIASHGTHSPAGFNVQRTSAYPPSRLLKAA